VSSRAFLHSPSRILGGICRAAEPHLLGRRALLRRLQEHTRTHRWR
jgi:hypothetical protein